MSVPKAVFGCTNATVVPAAAGAGLLIDHAMAVGFDSRERSRAVVDAVADVMEPFTFRVEIFRDGRIGAAGREQLDIRVGDVQERLLHAVPVDDLAVVDLTSERRAVVVDRSLEVAYRDGHMIDFGEQHATSSPSPRIVGSAGCRDEGSGLQHRGDGFGNCRSVDVAVAARRPVAVTPPSRRIR